ncbi:hypothetical protein B0H10DRAFT_1811271 [Mycena sp. CBHHK59/15]|nr:hypothetical protein B0H10DRAFT_1811271 [Mycena sp. CBHHK59/15]
MSESQPKKHQKRKPNASLTEARSSPTLGCSRVKGRLSGIVDLPLDVLYEVMCCLTLLDLLCISRVSKSFRDLVLSLSARIIWQEAHANVPGIPPTVSGMSEPAMMSLLFEKFCNVDSFLPPSG